MSLGEGISETGLNVFYNICRRTAPWCGASLGRGTAYILQAYPTSTGSLDCASLALNLRSMLWKDFTSSLKPSRFKGATTFSVICRIEIIFGFTIMLKIKPYRRACYYCARALVELSMLPKEHTEHWQNTSYRILKFGNTSTVLVRMDLLSPSLSAGIVRCRDLLTPSICEVRECLPEYQK